MKHLSRIILAIFIGSAQWVAASAGSDRIVRDPEVQFQRAVQLETIEGNLNAAIDLYRQVIHDNGNNRALAAKALLRLGGCYEKQGNMEASKAYEQLLRDYADQADSAAEARTRLAALHKPAAPGTGPSTRRVWAGPKTDFYGSVSPDGKYLSFVDWDTGDLAVRDLEKGTNRRLTNNGSWESNSDGEAELSIWSPDGKQIAYQWDQWKTKPYGYELRLISLDDPTPKILCPIENSEEWIDPLDWSPDGKQILAAVNRNGADQRMVLVSVADGKVRTLKTFSKRIAGASISPDGRHVLYDYPQSASSMAHDIFVMPITGGSETPLIEYPADDRALGWGPDRKWVLFTSDRRGSVDVWAIQVEDGKPEGVPVMLKPAIGRIHPLGITRSGSLYFGMGDARNDVYVVKLDRASGDVVGPATKLVRHSEGFNRSPRYSPDGKYLAYISANASNAGNAVGWGDTLCVLSLETGEEREYQREMSRLGVRWTGFPRWSPDGKSILLFGRNTRGRYGIYHIDLETGKAASVLRQGEDLFIGPAQGWRNARSFFYGVRDEKNNRAQIIQRDLDSGDEKIVHQVSLSDFARGGFSVSRDGRWLSILDRLKSGESILSIISADSGAIKRKFRISKDEAPSHLQLAWSADRKYVFYTRRVETQGSYKFELWRIPVDGGQPQKTGFEMPGVVFHLSAHPDGEHLAFENMAPMSQSPAEVWVMENFLPR